MRFGAASEAAEGRGNERPQRPAVWQTSGLAHRRRLPRQPLAPAGILPNSGLRSRLRMRFRAASEAAAGRGNERPQRPAVWQTSGHAHRRRRAQQPLAPAGILANSGLRSRLRMRVPAFRPRSEPRVKRPQAAGTSGHNGWPSWQTSGLAQRRRRARQPLAPAGILPNSGLRSRLRMRFGAASEAAEGCGNERPQRPAVWQTGGLAHRRRLPRQPLAPVAAPNARPGVPPRCQTWSCVSGSARARCERRSRRSDPR